MGAWVLKKREAPLPLKELAWRLVNFVVKCGKSNPVSFGLRPIFTSRHLRMIVGINMAILAVIVAVWSPVTLAGENTGGRLELVVRPEGEVVLTTKAAVVVPLLNYHVSQSFWWAHPGIDMAAATGEPVRPVMVGKVEHVEKGWFGYGNHVIVGHGDGFESLYGHLSKINVAEGQDVNTETVIGLVGSTGHSSGPHLHLEIRQDGQALNPKTILGIK